MPIKELLRQLGVFWLLFASLSLLFFVAYKAVSYTLDTQIIYQVIYLNATLCLIGFFFYRKKIYLYLSNRFSIISSSICLAIIALLYVFSNSLSIKLIFILSIVAFSEELVFRLYCGDIFKKYLNSNLGSYASIVFFSWAHSIVHLELETLSTWGVSLGPLILGSLCELVWRKYQALGAAMSLHFLVNLTTWLAYPYFPDWIQKLKVLYLGVPEGLY